MLTLLGAPEAELRTPRDDVDLVVDVTLQHLGEVERAGNALDEGDDVDGERRLQLGELEEVVEHDVGVGVALEGDDELGLALCGLVVDIGDAVEVATVDKLLDPGGDRRATRLVGQLGDDDLQRPLLRLLDRCRGAQLDAAATGPVGVHDPGSPEDARSGRKVGTLDELHQLVRRRLRVVDEVHRGVDDLPEVVRRNVRRHPDGDALRAVDEQVGEARRQHRRLFPGAVVVGHHVDGVLIDVGEQLHRQRRQPAFRITLCSRSEVWGSVVPVELDQWMAQGERLGHAHERVVDRRVAVWVVVGHRVARDAGALDEVAVGTEALLLHVPDDPAMHRLEPVTDIGQRPRRDDRHRVVEERALHLVLQADGLDRLEGQFGGKCCVRHWVLALRNPDFERRGRWWR